MKAFDKSDIAGLKLNENQEERTGMHLFKKLRHQEKNGDGMSADEWEWYKRKQKESDKYKVRIIRGTYKCEER
ncbi:hypothetical protein [Larkinella sp. C7]|uniref:hypothetical protein n=1 Tax=Larkinella sp. C7 TaxID=2576607 RepID=UPI0011111AA6|nr:hypothetical protein [Larkinella sp. C7]